MVQDMDGKVAAPIGEPESKIIVYINKFNKFDDYQRINLV